MPQLPGLVIDESGAIGKKKPYYLKRLEQFPVPALRVPAVAPQPAEPFVGPVQQTPEQRLEDELARMDQPVSLKRRLLSAAIPAAAVGLSGAFGGLEGAEGAAEGVSSLQDELRQNQMRRRAQVEGQLGDFAERRDRMEAASLARDLQRQQMEQGAVQFGKTQERIREEGEAGRSLQRELDAAAAARENAPQPFTLSPGQQRFGPNNEPLASVPSPAPSPRSAQTVTTDNGIFVLNPDGTLGNRLGDSPRPAPSPRNIDPLSPEGIRARAELEKLIKGPQGETSPYATERATRTIQSVDELIGKVSRWTTGAGSLLSGIPEMSARNFKAELDTLKANIAFNELTAMREASKTGGALGQVSNVELGLLQSALGALDTGQSPENLKAQLQKIRDSVARWQKAQTGIKSGPRVGEVQDGYVFLGGDPANPESWRKQ